MRLGIDDADSILCGKAVDSSAPFPYCHGDSEERFLSRRRGQCLSELEMQFHSLWQRAREAGEVVVSQFEKDYAEHLANLSKRQSLDECSNSRTTSVPKVEAVSFVPTRIITPKVKESVFSTPLLCSPQVPEPVDSTRVHGDSYSQAVPLSMSTPFEKKNVFMSTPINLSNKPAFSPPVTAVKEPPSLFPRNESPAFPMERQIFEASAPSTSTEASSGACEKKIACSENAVVPDRILDFYFSEIMVKRDVDVLVRNFEAKATPAERSIIKRTIIERITVCSKKHAPVVDIAATAEYLAHLFDGKRLVGINDKLLHLTTPSEVAYAQSITCDHYLKLVEQDVELVDVVANILIYIVNGSIKFGQLLQAKLITASVFLSLDSEQCETKCAAMLSTPGLGAAFLGQQRALMRLFFSLHHASHRLTPCAVFALKNVWRMFAFLVNSKPVPLATPSVLSELFQVCGRDLLAAYGRIMRKAVAVVRFSLLQMLEDELENSTTLQRAGQAMHLSVLRNTIDNLE